MRMLACMHAPTHKRHIGQYSSANGVVGRIVDALTSQPSPFKTASYSITGNAKILAGSNADIIDRRAGVVRLASDGTLAADLCELISANQSASLFADTYAASFESALNRTEALARTLDDVVLNEKFETAEDADPKLMQQFQQVWPEVCCCMLRRILPWMSQIHN